MQGTVITPRLADKIGQYFDRGALICVVEDLTNLEAEISVAERDAEILTSGQTVQLKPRSLPMVSLAGRVDRVSPAVFTADAANASDVGQSKPVIAYCQVENSNGVLRGGMTGFGKIYFDTQPLGVVLCRRAVKMLRAEFRL